MEISSLRSVSGKGANIQTQLRLGASGLSFQLLSTKNLHKAIVDISSYYLRAPYGTQRRFKGQSLSVYYWTPLVDVDCLGDLQ